MTVPAFSAVMLMIGTPALAEETPPVPFVAPASFVAPIAFVALAAEVQATAPHATGAQPDPAATATASQVQPPPATSEPEDDAIVVTGRRHDPGDPLEKINEQSFEVTQAIDTAVIRPVALGYQRALPAPVRDGIRNILNNLREPVTFLNNILQLKIGRAGRTLGRFVVNSTIGVAGIVDVASRKPFRIQRKPNGFANTLGYYGVKTGIFFYLPVVGPTTVRDLIGTTIDRFVVPFAVGKPFSEPAFAIPAGVFGTLDNRAQFDETLETLKNDTPDSYVATREFYLARRQAEIDELHGKARRIVKPTPGSVKPQFIDPSK